jgi:hypothetical protein
MSGSPGRHATVEFDAEHGDRVGEGVGLLGVGDVATVLDLDKTRAGQPRRQSTSDGPERWVAGAAGDDERRDRDRGQVCGADIERW